MVRWGRGSRKEREAFNKLTLYRWHITELITIDGLPIDQSLNGTIQLCYLAGNAPSLLVLLTLVSASLHLQSSTSSGHISLHKHALLIIVL